MNWGELTPVGAARGGGDAGHNQSEVLVGDHCFGFFSVLEVEGDDLDRAEDRGGFYALYLLKGDSLEFFLNRCDAIWAIKDEWLCGESLDG